MASRCPRPSPYRWLDATCWSYAENGAYGMMELPVAMFPDALLFYQDLVMFIGLVSLVWGAVVCLGQTNLENGRIFFSITHGVILLGIASMQPIGYAAALFMMFAHGLISPMLFAVCGAFNIITIQWKSVQCVGWQNGVHLWQSTCFLGWPVWDYLCLQDSLLRSWS